MQNNKARKKKRREEGKGKILSIATSNLSEENERAVRERG